MLDTQFSDADYEYMDKHPQVMGENLEHYIKRVRSRKGDYHTFGSALGDIGNLAVELMGAKRGYNKRKTITRVRKQKKTIGSHNINITIKNASGTRPRASSGTATAGRRIQQIQPSGMTFPNRSNALLQRTGLGFQGYGLDPQSQQNLAQVLTKSQEVNAKLDKQTEKIEEAIQPYIFKRGELKKKSDLYGIPEEMLREAAEAGVEPREYYKMIIEGAPEEFSTEEKKMAGYPVSEPVKIKEEPVGARYNPLEMGSEKATKKRNVEYLGRYYTPTEMRYIVEGEQYMAGEGTKEEPYIEV